MTAQPLSSAENERTIRQQTLPEFGAHGQRLLANATVAVVGAGGLGSPVIEYLAAAGVGHLIIVDDDIIELSNLHRQVIHSAANIGSSKVSSAATAAKRVAPECTVTEVHERLTRSNATELLGAADVIVDGSDTFDTRFDVHHAALELGVPVVWGAVLRWDAQVTVFWPSPANPAVPAIALTDVFADTDETRQTVSCAIAGVIGAVCGQAGSLMALETIKLLTGIGTPLLGRMAIIDGLRAETTAISVGNIPTEMDALPPVTALTTVPDNAVLIDVRTEAEWGSAPGLAGSTNVPLARILRLRMSDLTSDAHSAVWAEVSTEAPLVFVCAQGPRSARAARHVASLGLPVAGFLDGGLA